MTTAKTLIYGYGNPGRQDDALGVLCCQELEAICKQNHCTDTDFETAYQLNIEDAETIGNYEYVIFIDASAEDIEDIKFTPVIPETKINFSMHATSAGFILDLCNKMFSKTPRIFMLHIKGYEWDFMKRPTPGATKNLKKAISFLLPYASATAENREQLYATHTLTL